MDEKSYENISIYDAAYNTLYDAKPLRLIFDKVHGHIKKNDTTKYLTLVLNMTFNLNETYFLEKFPTWRYLPLKASKNCPN